MYENRSEMIDVLKKNASSRKRTVYNKIIDEIESAINQGILAPGTPLPSEKILVEEYGVSRSSVRSALEVLEAKRLIFRKPGKGTFVKNSEYDEGVSNSHVNTLAIDISSVDTISMLYSGIIFNEVSNVSEKRDCRLTCVSRNQLPLLGTGLADSLFSVGAWLGKYDVYNMLYKKGVSPLLFNRIVDLEGISYVAVDYRKAAEQAMNELLKKGHTKIGWIDVDYADSIFALRYRGMMDAVNNSQSNIDLHACSVPACMSDEYYRDEIIKFMRSSDVSAVYLMSGCFAAPVFSAARHLGMKIPDDIEVISFDRIEKLYFHYEVPFMYVKMPLEEMARDAANYLIDRMESGNTIPVLKKIYKSEVISVGY